VAYVRRNAVVLKEEYGEAGIFMNAILSVKDQMMLAAYLKN
jgi:hypothetical protein